MVFSYYLIRLEIYVYLTFITFLFISYKLKSVIKGSNLPDTVGLLLGRNSLKPKGITDYVVVVDCIYSGSIAIIILVPTVWAFERTVHCQLFLPFVMLAAPLAPGLEVLFALIPCWSMLLIV